MVFVDVFWLSVILDTSEVLIPRRLRKNIKYPVPLILTLCNFNFFNCEKSPFRAISLGISTVDAYRFFLAKLVIHKPNREKLVCSGSLINAKFILSAAHCFCSIFMPCGEKGKTVVEDSITCEFWLFDLCSTVGSLTFNCTTVNCPTINFQTSNCPTFPYPTVNFQMSSCKLWTAQLSNWLIVRLYNCQL